jgi:hypothetical protein
MAGLEGASCTLELKIPSRDLLFSFLNSPSFLFAVQGFAFPSDVIRRHFPVFFLVFLGICFSKSCDLTMYVEFRRNSPLFLFAVQGFAFPCDIIHRLFPVYRQFLARDTGFASGARCRLPGPRVGRWREQG